MDGSGSVGALDDLVLRAIAAAVDGGQGCADGYLAHLPAALHGRAQEALNRLEQRGLVRVIRERPYGPCTAWPRRITAMGRQHLRDVGG